MSVSDPVADFISCIKNASKAKKQEVIVPSSKMKVCIGEVLKGEKFVRDVKILDEGAKKKLKIYLKYLKSGQPAIKDIKKISKPGLRRYVGADKMPRVRNGLGIVIVSTSRGFMTGDEARKENVGGEIICKVW